MPRLCTGCGLTTDDDGNLIAAVSGGTYEDVYTGESCSASGGGGKVFCSEVDGKLYVAPEPMYRQWNFVNEIQPVQPVGTDGRQHLSLFTVPEPLSDQFTKDFSASVGTITNPSKCRPMGLFIEIGIQHALFTVDSGGPAAADHAIGDIQIEAYYSLSGDLTAAMQGGGHQHWGAEASGGTTSRRQIYRFDSSGAFLDLGGKADGTADYILPPGGSVTLTSIARLIVIRYETTGQGNVTLDNWRNSIRVAGWAGA